MFCLFALTHSICVHLCVRWAEVRSACGLSGNIPMNSNLAPAGNNPSWDKVPLEKTACA